MDCGDAELIDVLANLSVRVNFGVSPDVATAKACVAAAELIRRRDDRDEVTTTPGRTFFKELSVAFRRLCRGEERTSLRRFAKSENSLFGSMGGISYRAKEHSAMLFDWLEHSNPTEIVADLMDYRFFRLVESFALPGVKSVRRNVFHGTCSYFFDTDAWIYL